MPRRPRRLSGWQKWIVLIACVVTLFVGLYRVDAISGELQHVCSLTEAGCDYPVWAETTQTG